MGFWSDLYDDLFNWDSDTKITSNSYSYEDFHSDDYREETDLYDDYKGDDFEDDDLKKRRRISGYS